MVLSSHFAELNVGLTRTAHSGFEDIEVENSARHLGFACWSQDLRSRAALPIPQRDWNVFAGSGSGISLQ